MYWRQILLYVLFEAAILIEPKNNDDQEHPAVVLVAFYLNDYCFRGVITLQLNVVIRENKSNYNNNSEKKQ